MNILLEIKKIIISYNKNIPCQCLSIALFSEEGTIHAFHAQQPDVRRNQIDLLRPFTTVSYIFQVGRFLNSLINLYMAYAYTVQFLF